MASAIFGRVRTDRESNCCSNCNQVYADGQHKPEERDMKRIVINAVVLVAIVAAFAACKKADDGMGPAQKAGAAVDAVGDKVARDLHANIDKANEVAKQAAKNAEATSAKIEEATTGKINQAARDASEGLSTATEEVGKKVERAGEKIQESARK
jgi:predicted small secreted protein